MFSEIASRLNELYTGDRRWEWFWGTILIFEANVYLVAFLVIRALAWLDKPIPPSTEKESR